MCVILVCKDKKPSNIILKKAQRQNNDGIGIGYYENNQLIIKKGLKLKQLRKLVSSINLPFTIHFRFTTSGVTCKELIHPFLIDSTSPIVLSGKVSNDVLFHNGHLSDCGTLLEQAYNENRLSTSDILELNKAPISDSRIMAVLKSIKQDDEFIRDIGYQKVIVMRYNKVEINGYGNFIQDNGIYYSNQSFLTKYTNYHDYGNLSTYTNTYNYKYDKWLDYDDYDYKNDGIYDKEIDKWSKYLKRELLPDELDDIWQYGYPTSIPKAEYMML